MCIGFELTCVDAYAVYGIGDGFDHLAVGRHGFPKGVIVEIALVGLFGGVIDILHINKQDYLFHTASRAWD